MRETSSRAPNIIWSRLGVPQVGSFLPDILVGVRFHAFMQQKLPKRLGTLENDMIKLRWLIVIPLILSGHVESFSAEKNDKNWFEINTVLMESTVKIEGL